MHSGRFPRSEETSILQIERFARVLQAGLPLYLKDVKQLCLLAIDTILRDANVVEITAPVSICGDLHGQFYDVLELFKIAGHIPECSYIFMGDYVDRGAFSAETLLYLLALKVRYPDRLTLLRGNHETRQLTQVYGFYDECLNKFGAINVWKYCTEVFDALPICALVNGRILCLHGGISGGFVHVDDVRNLARQGEVPSAGLISDILWSDPEDEIDTFHVSPRGAGFLFGKDQTLTFCERNGLDMIARAHQVVMDGYREMFDGKCVTVWSAPDYMYRIGNKASVLSIDDFGKKRYVTFQACPKGLRRAPTAKKSPILQPLVRPPLYFAGE